MSRVTTMMERTQRIASAAIEECRRLGHPQVDLEHLFLALVVVGGPAGGVLRENGVTLGPARAALEKVHVDRVATLGITTPLPAGPRAVPEPSSAQTPWAPRAMKMTGVLDHDDRALLAALLKAPGASITEMLDELGVQAGVLESSTATRTHDAPSLETAAVLPRPRSADSTWCAVDVDGYVPADVQDVWDLLSDPARRLEWDTAADVDAHVADDGTPDLAPTISTPDRRGRRPRRRDAGTVHTIIALEPNQLIEWEVTMPDHPKAHPIRLAIALHPDDEGTRMVLCSRWRRRHGITGITQKAVEPLLRFAVHQSLIVKEAAISRRFR